jgi:hypothetical protein
MTCRSTAEQTSPAVPKVGAIEELRLHLVPVTRAAAPASSAKVHRRTFGYAPSRPIPVRWRRTSPTQSSARGLRTAEHPSARVPLVDPLAGQGASCNRASGPAHLLGSHTRRRRLGSASAEVSVPAQRLPGLPQLGVLGAKCMQAVGPGWVIDRHLDQGDGDARVGPIAALARGARTIGY